MKGSELVINMHTKDESAKLDAALHGRIQLDFTKAHIVEAMTGFGRTGLIFELTDADGKKYFAKLTARIVVNGVAAAARGFMHRVGDNPDLP